MARNLLITILLSLATLSIAQTDIPNSSFEEWIIEGNDTLPKNWKMSQFGAAASTETNSGYLAASIWNWYCYAKGTLSSEVIPVDFHPAMGQLFFEGEYTYILGENGGSGHGANDSAVVTIVLRSKDADTVGFVMAKLGPSDSYSDFSIPIALSGTADSLEIFFQSSEQGFCSSENCECLYLTVDNLSTTFLLEGVEDIQVSEPGATPNPFQQRTLLGAAPKGGCKLIVTSSSGVNVFAQEYRADQPIIFTADGLAAGTYLYRIISKIDIRMGKVIKQ
jgi:hypothetical protein